MSGAVIAASAGASAAVAAAAARKKMLEEEEEMTGYNKEDLNGWEFKIVRANTSKFKDPEVLRQVCDEEAQSGWELLEKFDNQRLRFKRRSDKRGNDQFATGDPYRTHIGATEGQIVAIVFGILGVVGALAFLVFILARQ